MSRGLAINVVILIVAVVVKSQDIFRWLNVVEVAGEGRRIKVWGRLSNFSDSSGVNHTFASFLGLPFAVPPTNHLRFQRPTLRILDKDFRASTPSPPCPQLIGGVLVGDEDCLNLNIFMPILEDSVKMPVMIWAHGDSPDRTGKLEPLTTGSALEVDPSLFMAGRVVLVVPQFRLGTLGFASTVNEDLNGNVGLFDLLLSLEWVQKFIVHFSGDPIQVTLLGHSNAGLLAMTELAKGLFQRLILMTGSPLGPLSLDFTPKVTYGEVALQNNCPSFPSSHFVRCMQGRRLSSIVKADQRLSTRGLSKLRLPLPLVQKDDDGRFLPPLLFRTPMATLKEGSFMHVPLIIGVTSQEMRGYLPSLIGAEEPAEVKVFSSHATLQHFIRSLISRYSSSLDPELASELLTFEYFAGLNISSPERKEQAVDLLEEMLGDYLFTVPALALAELWAKHAPVYFYLFDHGNKLFHGSDIEFLMRGGTSAQDRELSSIMIQLWTTFVHQGSPLNAGIEWPQWREESGRQLLVLSGDRVDIAMGLRQRQFHLWTRLLPSVAASNKCPKLGSLIANNRGKTTQLLFRDVDEDEASKKFFILDKLE